MYCTFTFQDLGAVVGVDETSWGGVKALFR